MGLILTITATIAVMTGSSFKYYVPNCSEKSLVIKHLNGKSQEEFHHI